jgi:hypothetical protein
MNTLTTAKNQGRLPAVHGNARWVGLVPTQHGLDCGCGWLEIRGENGNTGNYWVKTVRGEGGEVLGYNLLRFDLETDVTLADYDLDLGAGTCECKDFLMRAHRREGGGCRHVNALRASLVKAGLEILQGGKPAGCVSVERGT